MPDPIHDRDHLSDLLTQVAEAACDYLARVDQLPAGGTERRDQATPRFAGEPPEDGKGSLETVASLPTQRAEAATHSARPPFFHFLTGGSTPPAPAAHLPS